MYHAAVNDSTCAAVTLMRRKPDLIMMNILRVLANLISCYRGRY